MNFEKDYYEYDGFWRDYESCYRDNIEKINITFEFIQDDVKSILDAACGNGLFSNLLLEKKPNLKIVSFDRSEAALKYVKTEKYLAEIDNIPFQNKEFDCLVVHDVIEHLPIGVYEQSLKEICRVANKYIIVGVPNNEKVLDRSTQCPSCRAIFNYDLHMRSFSKQKMSNLFSEYGFSCLNIKTCDNNTFYYGQNIYSKIINPGYYNRFKSPICPICGYLNPKQNVESDHHSNIIIKRTGSVEMIKKVIRILWPKYSFDYEMVALFKRD